MRRSGGSRGAASIWGGQPRFGVGARGGARRKACWRRRPPGDGDGFLHASSDGDVAAPFARVDRRFLTGGAAAGPPVTASPCGCSVLALHSCRLAAAAVNSSSLPKATASTTRMLPTTATASAPPPAAGAGASASSSAGEPHAALLLALGHMRLRELLACARSCRGLRDAVAGDPLLWLRLTVEPPLSHRVTDEALLALTDRAGGRLRSLHLLGCPRVSDDGLLRVVQRNPGVTELFVPRCTGLTADGLVKIIQFLHECNGNLSHVRLHGICKMTNHHLEVINSLICRSSQQDAQALYYNHRVHEVLNTNDSRPIDVDVCPLCRNVRLVFDCTRKDCRAVQDGWTRCRGCFFCVARCEACGGCIDLEELGETGLACSDFLCMDCWLKLPKCSTCNRPYCERHSNLKENLSPSGQFTCQECTAFATSLESLGDGD